MSSTQSRGYALSELMIVVALIGIVGAISIPIGVQSWRREQANAAVLDLAGWLAEVQRTTNSSNVSCRVNLTTGTSLAAQSVLATATAIQPGTTTPVTGVTCGTGNPLRLPGIAGTPTFRVGSSIPANTLYFTQRGAISTDNLVSSAASTDFSVRVSVDGQIPMRCVRLSGMLGLIRLGSNSTTGNTSSNCNNWGAL
jgi:prepilin-type N-terminal cleavage/methylation domain-containing protein